MIKVISFNLGEIYGTFEICKWRYVVKMQSCEMNGPGHNKVLDYLYFLNFFRLVISSNAIFLVTALLLNFHEKLYEDSVSVRYIFICRYYEIFIVFQHS